MDEDDIEVMKVYEKVRGFNFRALTHAQLNAVNNVNIYAVGLADFMSRADNETMEDILARTEVIAREELDRIGVRMNMPINYMKLIFAQMLIILASEIVPQDDKKTDMLERAFKRDTDMAVM